MNDFAKLPGGVGDALHGLQAVLVPIELALLHWVQALSPVLTAAIAAVTLVAAVIGARRPMVRLVAASVGFWLGMLYANRFQPWLEFVHLPWRYLTLGLGAAFAVFGALLPEGITFSVGGFFLGSEIASFFPSDDRAFAFVPAFLVGGAAGVMVFPLLAALVSSLGGGLVCAACIAVLLPRATLGGYLLVHPLTTMAVGLAIGLAGLLGQLRSPPDERFSDGPGGAREAASKPAKSSSSEQKPRRRRAKGKAKARAET